VASSFFPRLLPLRVNALKHGRDDSVEPDDRARPMPPRAKKSRVVEEESSDVHAWLGVDKPSDYTPVKYNSNSRFRATKSVTRATRKAAPQAVVPPPADADVALLAIEWEAYFKAVVVNAVPPAMVVDAQTEIHASGLPSAPVDAEVDAETEIHASGVDPDAAVDAETEIYASGLPSAPPAMAVEAETEIHASGVDPDAEVDAETGIHASGVDSVSPDVEVEAETEIRASDAPTFGSFYGPPHLVAFMSNTHGGIAPLPIPPAPPAEVEAETEIRASDAPAFGSFYGPPHLVAFMSNTHGGIVPLPITSAPTADVADEAETEIAASGVPSVSFDAAVDAEAIIRASDFMHAVKLEHRFGAVACDYDDAPCIDLSLDTDGGSDGCVGDDQELEWEFDNLGVPVPADPAVLGATVRYDSMTLISCENTGNGFADLTVTISGVEYDDMSTYSLWFALMKRETQ